MKKHFCKITAILLGILCMLAILPAGAAFAAGTVSITADSISANPGDVVTLSFHAGKSDGVIGFGIGVDYDESVLSYVSDSIVYMPDYTGSSPKYSATNVTGSCGCPVLAQCTLNPAYPMVKTSFTLFQISFRISEKAGNCQIVILPKVAVPGGCIYGWDTTAKYGQVNYDAQISEGVITVGKGGKRVEPEPVIVDSGETSDTDNTSETGGNTSDPVTSDKTSPKTSDVTPGKTSDVKPGKTSDVTSDKTSDKKHGKTSDVTSDKTSDRTSDYTSDVSSDVTSGSSSDQTSDVTSGYSSDVPSGYTSGSSEIPSGYSSEAVSGQTSGTSGKSQPADADRETSGSDASNAYDIDDEKPPVGWIIAVVIAVLAVAGGAVAFFLIRKKKTVAENTPSDDEK